MYGKKTAKININLINQQLLFFLKIMNNGSFFYFNRQTYEMKNIKNSFHIVKYDLKRELSYAAVSRERGY